MVGVPSWCAGTCRALFLAGLSPLAYRMDRSGQCRGHRAADGSGAAVTANYRGLERWAARPAAVSLERVAQQYARATAGIGIDQLWAALRQWGAATLTGREGL